MGFIDGQSPAKGLDSRQRLALVAQDARQVVGVAGDMGMVGAQGRFVDCQSLFEQGLRLVEVAHVVKDQREMVGIGCDLRIGGAEGGEIDFAGTGKVALRGKEIAQFVRDAAEIAQDRGKFTVVKSEIGFESGEAQFQAATLCAEIAAPIKR